MHPSYASSYPLWHIHPGYDIMHPSYASSYPLWHYTFRLCQHLPFTSYIQAMPALTLYDIIHPNYASSDLCDIYTSGLCQLLPFMTYIQTMPALTFVTFIHPSYGGSKPNHQWQIELARFIWSLMAQRPQCAHFIWIPSTHWTKHILRQFVPLIKGNIKKLEGRVGSMIAEGRESMKLEVNIFE